ncbi:hypothetical protein [Streptomyces albus]|uniref:hypothetical protein n=1 Tax=Streptomyces albus TaxID=1888 RepID=UPI0033FADAD5
MREFLRRVRLDPDEADLHEQKLIEWRAAAPTCGGKAMVPETRCTCERAAPA